jgi:hypothetical protein
LKEDINKKLKALQFESDWDYKSPEEIDLEVSKVEIVSSIE